MAKRKRSAARRVTMWECTAAPGVPCDYQTPPNEGCYSCYGVGDRFVCSNPDAQRAARRRGGERHGA